MMDNLDIETKLVSAVNKACEEVFGNQKLSETILILIQKSRVNIEDANFMLEEYINIIIDELREAEN